MTVKPILPFLDAGECVSVRPISVYSIPGHERHVVSVMSDGFSIFEGEGLRLDRPECCESNAASRASESEYHVADVPAIEYLLHCDHLGCYFKILNFEV